jgi:hypothetical protein
LIASGNFISVNRDLIKVFGLETAILIGELASEYDYYSKRNELDDGCFYSTVKNIKENTGLSEYQQRQAFKILIEYGIVDIIKKGLPAKRYVRINEQVFLDVWDKCCKNYGTGAVKIKAQETSKLNTNNNINNKNKLNNNIYKGIKQSLTGLTNNIDKDKKENNIYYNSEFENLWKEYPRKQGKDKALKAYVKFRASGGDVEKVKQGIERYKRYIEVNKIEQRYIKHGSTWFIGQCWDDEYEQAQERKEYYSSYDIDELEKIR